MTHAFLLMGQSNMAGRGNMDELPYEVDLRLFMLRNGKFTLLFRPVHPDRVFSGVCLGESFARAYADAHPGVDVGLIPCAEGNSYLDHWMPGEILFDNAVQQTKMALRSAEIKGVLWHQGECDCRDHLWPTYRDRALKVFRAFREAVPELGQVPFIVGGLGDFLLRDEPPAPDEQGDSYLRVNEQLRRLAEEDWIGYVPAEGLGCNEDRIHFSAAALDEFGRRYYEVWKRTAADGM
ncbi:MAG: sialate O-acetylesterase [Clostridia bacterium]|nr:sialate O-acetylesterase [Clostridia bacterium]